MGVIIGKFSLIFNTQGLFGILRKLAVLFSGARTMTNKTIQTKDIIL